MIGLYGGTFDPVHVGHMQVAQTVCDALPLRQLHMVLSARPSHRGVPGAAIMHRWCMLHIACAADGRLCPDDREAVQNTPSYTVHTLQNVRAQHGRSPVYFVIGSDSLQQLRTWRDWRSLLELAHLVVLRRPGFDADELPGEYGDYVRARRVAEASQAPAGTILVLDAVMPDVSATAIRTAVAAGNVPDTLLPSGVADYIMTHRLYHNSQDSHTQQVR